MAALLHDVGKVAIPPEILDKPCRSQRRRSGGRSSSTRASARSSSSRRPRSRTPCRSSSTTTSATAGHGYPYGLRANEIPLGARIVAVADAYDAMVNDRPYKRAMSHEQAIAELRRHAGTQFDPELVELFCDLYATHAPEPDVQVLAMNARRPPTRAGPERPWSFPSPALGGPGSVDDGPTCARPIRRLRVSPPGPAVSADVAVDRGAGEPSATEAVRPRRRTPQRRTITG